MNKKSDNRDGFIKCLFSNYMSSCMNKKRSIHIHFSVYVCVYVFMYVWSGYEYIILTDGVKRTELFISLKTWGKSIIICVKLTYNNLSFCICLISTYISSKLITFFYSFLNIFHFFCIFMFFMLSVIESTLKNAFISKISPMLTDWELPDVLSL